MSPARLGPVLLGLALATAAPAPARGSDAPVVAQLFTPTATIPQVAAYGGRVAWSTFDPELGAWRLMEASDGVVRAVPVQPRPEPFDVDVGPGLDGTPLAVYSRCGRRGCDLYAYSFATGSERRLANASAADESWPTVWRSRIAYVRSDSRPAWRWLDGRGRVHLLPRPRRRGTATELDMRRSRVAYTWTAPSARSTIRLATADGRSYRVGPAARSVGDAQLTARGVIWRLGTRLGRQLLTSRECRNGLAQTSEALNAAAIAHDAGRTYVVEGGAAGSFRLRKRTGIAFSAPLVSWRPLTDRHLMRSGAHASAVRCLSG